MTTTTREIHLVARPQGLPDDACFEMRTVELPDPGPEQVLVRNTVLSVDPYMRGRMSEAESYVEPFALGAPLEGGAVGEVLASGVAGLEPGDTVLHQAGWREHALLSGKEVRKVDTSRVPASAYLGVLGMPGLTAYVGLSRIARLQPGETVFVSGAAGAVGSLVGQFAKRMGAGRVVGSAGTADKVAWLTEEVGFDAAFDYHDGPVRHSLREALAGEKVDVFFDNVGGEHLEAALAAMADFGRIAVCGAISGYNAQEVPPGPRTITAVLTKRLTMQGFIVTEHAEAARDFYRDAGAWVADGGLVVRETWEEGLDRTVEAFRGLLTGANTGKMLVRL